MAKRISYLRHRIVIEKCGRAFGADAYSDAGSEHEWFGMIDIDSSAAGQLDSERAMTIRGGSRDASVQRLLLSDGEPV